MKKFLRNSEINKKIIQTLKEYSNEKNISAIKENKKKQTRLSIANGICEW